ncbi:MAG: response regulator transcription factor [Komarekiella atlantica HA4396-MV6]|jgi:DNA-binding NarL/FixJ family response regulator|nr:response regulator transcription factor [Komarekiella atlantica HA4396-MV6]
MLEVDLNKLANSQIQLEHQHLKPKKILVIDDHQMVLTGTLDVLKRQYPDTEFLQVKTARDALEIIAQTQATQEGMEQEKAALNLIVVDLSIPASERVTATTDTGIELIKQLLKEYPEQNFLVQSSYVKALVRIKHEIDNHQGGFAIADKNLLESEMLIRTSLALQGGTHTKDIKTGIELKPEWLQVLRLAFDEGLMDKPIADRMYKSERAIRNYWTKIQDVLGVYPEDCKEGGKSLRIQTEIRAREAGLID